MDIDLPDNFFSDDDEDEDTFETPTNGTAAKKLKIDKELYDGAHLKVSDFSRKLNQFRLAHHLPDRTTTALLKLFGDILPTGNRAPTRLKKMNKICDASMGENQAMTSRNLNPETDVFSITVQLCDIVKRKISTYPLHSLHMKFANKKHLCINALALSVYV